MRVVRNVLIGCLLSVAVLGVSGCSGQTEEANELIGQMNALTKQSNTLEARVTQLIDDVNKLSLTAEDAAKATPMLAEARTKLEQDKKNVQKVASLTDEIAALDVSDEMKTYAGKLKAITKIEAQEQAVSGEMLTVLGQLYDPKKASKYSQAEVNKLTNQLNDLVSKQGDLLDEISSKQDEAEQYFKENLQ